MNSLLTWNGWKWSTDSSKKLKCHQHLCHNGINKILSFFYSWCYLTLLPCGLYNARDFHRLILSDWSVPFSHKSPVTIAGNILNGILVSSIAPALNGNHFSLWYEPATNSCPSRNDSLMPPQCFPVNVEPAELKKPLDVSWVNAMHFLKRPQTLLARFWLPWSYSMKEML